MAEVSIIVPVYQVEQYLHKCIDSILSQTFKDFELILVDDGSYDKSGIICDEYAVQDNRIQVIHQKNQGVSVARNIAMQKARGEYLCFIDADDWIESTMIEKYMKEIKKNNADILRHGYTMDLWKDNSITQTKVYKAPNFCVKLSKDEIPEQMERFWENCSNYVWNYFFKTDFIVNIKFQSIKISEDHIFVLEALQKCKNIIFVQDNSYHYCMRMGSTANKWEETGIQCQLAMIKSCHEFMDYFHVRKEEKKKYMASKIIEAYSYSIYLMCFPKCRFTFKEKMKELYSIRTELQLDQYVSYAKGKSSSILNQIKIYLICRKMESILVAIGPIFMRLVRKANK